VREVTSGVDREAFVRGRGRLGGYQLEAKVTKESYEEE